MSRPQHHWPRCRLRIATSAPEFESARFILDEPANGLGTEGIAWMRELLRDFTGTQNQPDRDLGRDDPQSARCVRECGEGGALARGGLRLTPFAAASQLHLLNLRSGWAVRSRLSHLRRETN